MNKLLLRPRNIFILLILLFLFTRLYNLTLLPIFTDEAIYIYWAKYIATFHSHFFMSLTDGKPPFFIWVIAFFLKIFPVSMYLFAGRFVSVIAGGLTIVGVYKLSSLLFSSNKIGYIASLLCIINPFIIFYDRLALYDSMLSTFIIWSVYFTIKTSKTFSKKDALFWGVSLGLGFLTKPPAVIFLFLTPICFFILVWKKDWKKNINKIVLLPIIAIVVAELLNNIQRFSFNYQLMIEKNQKFQLPINELFSAPFYEVGKNLNLLFQWIIYFYTIPVFIAGIIGLLIILYKDFRKGILLFVLWFMPVVIFATVGKILFPRYILFVTTYFLIGFSAAIYMMRIDKLKFIILIILLSITFKFDYLLLTNPTKAPFPSVDYNQYITSEYSGYGLSNVFDYLDHELASGPRITLLTEGKFGLFPYAFMLKYWNDPRITIIPSWIPEKEDFDLYELAKSSKVLVVFSRQDDIPKLFPLRLIAKISKPNNKHVILITALKDK